MYYDEPGDVTHVIGREFGQETTYYYRRLEGLYWTPWEKIDLNIEDTPVLPVVWGGRLFLFWLSILEQAPMVPNVPETTPTGGTIADTSASAVEDVASNLAVQEWAILYWSEYFEGKWQPPKTSDIKDQFLIIGRSNPGAFKRQHLKLRSVVDEKLWLMIDYPENETLKIILNNTHSLPRLPEGDAVVLNEETQNTTIPIESEPQIIFTVMRSISDYSISHPLSASYTWISPISTVSHNILGSVRNYKIIAPRHYVDPLEGHFFFEDRQHVFFVRPDLGTAPLFTSDYGLQGNALPAGSKSMMPIDEKVEDLGPTQPKKNSPKIVYMIGSDIAMQYGDVVIGPAGAVTSIVEE
jgi:hypothetical protein